MGEVFTESHFKIEFLELQDDYLNILCIHTEQVTYDLRSERLGIETNNMPNINP